MSKMEFQDSWEAEKFEMQKWSQLQETPSRMKSVTLRNCSVWVWISVLNPKLGPKQTTVLFLLEKIKECSGVHSFQIFNQLEIPILWFYWSQGHLLTTCNTAPLQNLKWPPEGHKMAYRVWKGVFSLDFGGSYQLL